MVKCLLTIVSVLTKLYIQSNHMTIYIILETFPFFYSHFIKILFKFFEHASSNRVFGISNATFEDEWFSVAYPTFLSYTSAV